MHPRGLGTPSGGARDSVREEATPSVPTLMETWRGGARAFRTSKRRHPSEAVPTASERCDMYKPAHICAGCSFNFRANNQVDNTSNTTVLSEKSVHLSLLRRLTSFTYLQSSQGPTDLKVARSCMAAWVGSLGTYDWRVAFTIASAMAHIVPATRPGR